MLTQQRLKEVLYYDKVGGNFYWRHATKRNAIKPWSKAGTPHNKGYISIQLEGKRHQAHRLAWLYVNGAMPTQHIDHINGEKADNRFENLRHANNTTNHWNESTRSTNKSGHKGVWWHKQSRKWEAACRFNGKQIIVGRFERIQDAVEAVRKFREQHHGEYANHG